MSDGELLNQARREQLREIVSEVIAEQRALEEARQRAREQAEREELVLVPDRGEVGEQHRDFALGDLVLALPLYRRPGPGNQFRCGQQLLHVVDHRTLDVRGRHAGDRAAVVAIRDRLAVT
jgi:hypothetical protein